MSLSPWCCYHSDAIVVAALVAALVGCCFTKVSNKINPLLFTSPTPAALPPPASSLSCWCYAPPPQIWLEFRSILRAPPIDQLLSWGVRSLGWSLADSHSRLRFPLSSPSHPLHIRLWPWRLFPQQDGSNPDNCSTAPTFPLGSGSKLFHLALATIPTEPTGRQNAPPTSASPTRFQPTHYAVSTRVYASLTPLQPCDGGSFFSVAMDGVVELYFVSRTFV